MNANTYVFQNINFVDLTIYQYGKEECTSMLSCGPAIRQHYLLHYILSGEGTFSLTNGIDYRLTAGQAFLISPNSITHYVADRQNPWSYIWLEFDGLKAATILSDAGLSLKSPIYTPSPPSASEELKKRFSFFVENHEETSLMLIGNLYLLLDILTKTSSTKKVGKTGNLQEFYTREAINYIENNYDKNIAINDIANWCNLDRSYFGKIFKDTVLVTPQEFLIRYRMNKACDLLKNTSETIGAIAKLVGYENQLHFSRAFKNVYGESPSDFRKSKEPSGN